MSVQAESWYDREARRWVAQAFHLKAKGKTRDAALWRLREKIDDWVKRVRAEGNDVTFNW